MNAPNSIAHIDQYGNVGRAIEVGAQPTINLARLMSASERKRKFLSPHVLPAVKRKIVKSKFLKAIRRGIAPGAKRIIAVVAPAGYGKSTILGQIYDELRRLDLNWLLLLRCDDVVLEATPSDYSLSTALGEALSSARTPVTEIVAALTAEYGEGVLLIDTLDLLLSKEILSPLREVLSRLTEDGATVVFTCRNFEYDDVIEPVRANFADLKDSFDRYSVPEFDEREVRKATRHFIRADPALKSLFDADNFAREVLALSADEQRLRVIVYNPLLLALLCEFFARDGTIPPDLTVSKLYQRYWMVKISDSRKYGSTSPQAYAKNQLCLALARVLFHDSMRAGRLRPVANQADLDLALNRVVFEARAELLSEGVLESLPLDRLGYFHQTLLEYAIAYWLNTNAGAGDRADLFLKLAEDEASTSQLFWWAVVRQLLAIVDAEEFISLCSQLDTQRLAPFRAIALAAAARDESLRLLELLPEALSSGEPYQEALRLAVESLSSSHVDDEVEVLLTLIGKAQEVTAINSAQTMGNLLARRWSTLGHRLDEALKTATERTKQGPKNVALDEDRAKICGALLKPIFPQLGREFSSVAFASLRKYFKFFGINTRSSILQLHLSPIVPSSARRKLLRLIMMNALPNWSQNESDILELLTATLDDLLASADSVLGETYLSALHAELPPGWETVQARTIGRHAGRNLSLLEVILNDFFEGNVKNIHRDLVSLKEAIYQGAAEMVAVGLLAVPVTSIRTDRFSAIISLLEKSAIYFDRVNREALAVWLVPLAQERPREFIPALYSLAEDSPKVQGLLEEIIAKLPKEERSKQSIRLIRFKPIEQHPHIEELNKDAQLLLVRMYREQALTSTAFIPKLKEMSLSRSKSVAVAASGYLAELANENERIEVAEILPLAGSRFNGVRVNGLNVLNKLLRRGVTITESDLIFLCDTLSGENNPAVVRPLCELVAQWVRQHRSVPVSVAETVGAIAPRLKSKGTFDGGVGRMVISALKIIAQLEDRVIIDRVGLWARAVLRSIDLTQVSGYPESETISLLCAVDRYSSDFLAALVNEDCPTLPVRNVCVVVRAVKRVEGAHSPLLDFILSSEQFPDEAKDIILNARGA